MDNREKSWDCPSSWNNPVVSDNRRSDNRDLTVYVLDRSLFKTGLLVFKEHFSSDACRFYFVFCWDLVSGLIAFRRYAINFVYERLII